MSDEILYSTYLRPVELDSKEILWRYMTLPKYISLIEKKEIWLPRADQFEDQKEGSFPDEMKDIIQRAYDGMKNAPGPVADAEDFADFLKKNTFISCWHRNTQENMVMWAIYGKSSESVAIQTTVEKLLSSFNPMRIAGNWLDLKKVEYKTASEIPGVIPYEECFFIKRPHFHFEHEVRLCLDTYNTQAPSKQHPKGYPLPINVNKLIEKVLVHPDCPEWLLEVVRSVNAKYQIKAPPERGVCGNH